MLKAVSGESELAKAEIDLVVKTHENIQPDPENPRPYEEFCDYFAGTKTHFDLEHHLCHAYQAYLCSPFEDAAILTDRRPRRGPRAAQRTGALDLPLRRASDRVEVLSEVLWPASVGGMYSTATFHLGFRDEQEGNTMALAAFGTDRFYRVAREDAFDLHDDGTFSLRLRPTGMGSSGSIAWSSSARAASLGGPSRRITTTSPGAFRSSPRRSSSTSRKRSTRRRARPARDRRRRRVELRREREDPPRDPVSRSST